MMTPIRRLLVATAVLALVLTACGDGTDDAEPMTDEPDETTDDEGSDAEEDPDEEGEDAATEEGERSVTLLTHDSFDVSDEVLAAFTDDTGIEVEVVPLGDAGTALNQTILTADAPQGDLLFGVDNTFLSRALDEGIFRPYEPDALDALDPDLILDEEHRAIPIDRGDVCLNYDRAFFEEAEVEVPTELSDLTDPAYEGMLAVTNPATSSPGLAFLLATIETFGEDGYLDYWEELVANDVVTTDGWSEAYYDEFSGAGDGDRPLVVSYASSPPAEVLFAEEELDEAPTGVIESTCFRQIEFVGILEGAENPDEAEELVEFMLSPTFQEDIPLTMFVFPANQEAELPEVFEEHTVLPDDPIEMDHQTIGEHREQWIEDWTATVLR
ncbi:MAG: thiamine ABC transporter substrate binding subunit [Nitriliruptoraceae bacterium]